MWLHARLRIRQGFIGPMAQKQSGLQTFLSKVVCQMFDWEDQYSELYFQKQKKYPHPLTHMLFTSFG